MAYMFNRAGYSANTWSIGDLSNWDTINVETLSMILLVLVIVQRHGVLEILVIGIYHHLLTQHVMRFYN